MYFFFPHQWNAVALWAWDIVVDNCAICRNHIMDLCKFTFTQFWTQHCFPDRLCELLMIWSRQPLWNFTLTETNCWLFLSLVGIIWQYGRLYVVWYSYNLKAMPDQCKGCDFNYSELHWFKGEFTNLKVNKQMKMLVFYLQ